MTAPRQERLKELLTYDPETGLFTRNEDRGGYRAGSIAGAKHSEGYVAICVDKSPQLAHRLAWLYMTGGWPIEVDHINGVRSDNRWHNLREVNRTLNNANSRMKSNNKSGYKGVCWSAPCQKWRATIKVDGQQMHLGVFDDPVDAHKAYCTAAERHFGTHARFS